MRKVERVSHMANPKVVEYIRGPKFDIISGPPEDDLSTCIVRTLGATSYRVVQFECKYVDGGKTFTLELCRLKTRRGVENPWQNDFIALRGIDPNCVMVYNPRTGKGEGRMLYPV